MRDSLGSPLTSIERGVVWEETIILLPKSVRYVFLSATIPNSMEFAEWICQTHEQPCHVVYTDFRPTPLQHYLFPAGSEGIYLVVDERSSFREDNFQKAMAALAQGQGEDPSNPNSGRNKKGKTRKGGAMKGGCSLSTTTHGRREVRYLQDRSAHHDPWSQSSHHLRFLKARMRTSCDANVKA